MGVRVKRRSIELALLHDPALLPPTAEFIFIKRIKMCRTSSWENAG
jgi:hypothetical protein